MPNSAEHRRGRLARTIDSFLGFPQAGQHKKQQELQDELLPQFEEDARVSWFLSSPPADPESLLCVYNFLIGRTGDPAAKDRIQRLKYLLEELRVFDLLDAAAESPDLPVLNERRPAHEVRILSQSGHPGAAEEFELLLRRVVADPTKLSNARDTLDQSAAMIANQSHRIDPFHDADNKQLFSGCGNIFSGLVLLAANGAITSMATCSQGMSLALLSSFAGGIAMVDKGTEDLRTS